MQVVLYPVRGGVVGGLCRLRVIPLVRLSAIAYCLASVQYP